MLAMPLIRRRPSCAVNSTIKVRVFNEAHTDYGVADCLNARII